MENNQKAHHSGLFTYTKKGTTEKSVIPFLTYAY